MVDWNRNGRIDPEDVVLTEIIAQTEQEKTQDEMEEEIKRSGHLGCLPSLLVLPLLFVMGKGRP